MQLPPYISFYYMGRTKRWFKITRKLPHPQMAPRNELSIYLFTYSFTITWYLGV